MARLLAVVGGKHSGKTTVIEHVIKELRSRGFHMGVVKEMVRIPTLDTPAKETDRYTKAGAEAIVAVPKEETVIFVKRRLALNEILPHLVSVDFAVLEGFENEKNLPKIVAAKTASEARTYLDGHVFAISGLITKSEVEMKKAEKFQLPILSSVTQGRELADLVVEKAAASLP